MREFVKKGKFGYAIYLNERGVDEFFYGALDKFLKENEKWLRRIALDLREKHFEEYLIDIVEEEFFRSGLKDMIIVERASGRIDIYESPEEFVEILMSWMGGYEDNYKFDGEE